MSAVVRNTRGCVLDARALIDQGYSRCIRMRDQKSHLKCCFKRQCFQMLNSHYSVSASAAVDEGNTDMLHKTDKASKKRKRKHSELNQGEIDSQAFHDKIRSVVLAGTKSLVDSARSLGYLNGVAHTEEEPLPSQDCSLAALCEMAKELPLVDDEEQDQCVQPLVAEDGCTSHVDLFSRVTESGADWATVVTLMGEEYVIPPHTAFLLSDFTRIQPLVHYGRRFDLIVMDPPWENKSVKRSRRYSALPSSQLKRLPIPTLASPNCLVVTWVTNRPSHLRFVRDELYPHWGVEVVAEWFWVKVTTSGQFVFPLDSHHKKPYEVLVLGRYRSTADNTSSSDTSEVPVEDQRLIVSVPSALHSQKPSLSVLQHFVEHVRSAGVSGQRPRREATTLKSAALRNPDPLLLPSQMGLLSLAFAVAMERCGAPLHDNTSRWSSCRKKKSVCTGQGVCFLLIRAPCNFRKDEKGSPIPTQCYKVLKPHVGAEAKCLELFARSLQPGWTSWGNEVLKFQHTSYFTLTPTDDGAEVPEGSAVDTVPPGSSSPGEPSPPRRCPTTVD